MTEIEVHTDRPAADVVPYTPMPSDLLQWVEEARQAERIAKSLAKTNFVPQSLKGSAENVVAAILAGHELGLRPMAALRSLDIIQGTPALRAHAMRGLIQARGHKVWLVEQTPEKVVMRGQRREADGTYGPKQEVVWTIRRASEMGLTGKAEWKKQPATMLTARATGEICRLIASDVLHAMPYAAEELDGFRQAPRRAVAEQGEQLTAAEILGPDEFEADAEPIEVEGEVLT
jgi:hypothetical protein